MVSTLSWLAVISLGGCDGGVPESRWIVADSAGVVVVTTPATTLASAPRWTLDPEPLVDLGTVTGGGPTEFYRVRDVRFLPGERIVVADGGSEELRFFSMAGEHLHSAGRPGNGPREFKGLSRVWPRADSLITYDGGNDRFSVRGPWGEYARSFRLEWFSGLLQPEDVGDGSRILAITGRHMTQLEGSGALVDTALISFYDMEGRLLDSVARLPHNVRFVSRSGDMQTTLGAPFVAWASLVSVSEGFCYTFGTQAEVRCYGGDGELQAAYRLDAPPRPVTPAHLDAYWEEARASMTPQRWARYQRLREQMPFPERFSAFDRLLVDDRGRLWARSFEPLDEQAPRWWILQDGGVVAAFDPPPGLRVHDIRDGLLAGVWQDDLGVEHVRVYRLADEAA